MKILNPQVIKDLDSGLGIGLNLGSGPKKRAGYYSVDRLELDGIDIVADLNHPLDLLPDNCCKSIFSRHAFEHIENFLPLMEELFRILSHKGKMEIIVPHFSNVLGYSDPTHVRLFGLYTMYYFVRPEKQPDFRRVPAFYCHARFIVDSIRIEFYRNTPFEKLFIPLFQPLINLSLKTQDFYERRLSTLFHAWQIRYIMRPDKKIP